MSVVLFWCFCNLHGTLDVRCYGACAGAGGKRFGASNDIIICRYQHKLFQNQQQLIKTNLFGLLFVVSDGPFISFVNATMDRVVHVLIAHGQINTKKNIPQVERGKTPRREEKIIINVIVSHSSRYCHNIVPAILRAFYHVTNVKGITRFNNQPLFNQNAAFTDDNKLSIDIIFQRISRIRPLKASCGSFEQKKKDPAIVWFQWQ